MKALRNRYLESVTLIGESPSLAQPQGPDAEVIDSAALPIRTQVRTVDKQLMESPRERKSARRARSVHKRRRERGPADHVVIGRRRGAALFCVVVDRDEVRP